MSTIQYEDESSHNPVGYIHLTGDRSGSETSTCSTFDDDSKSSETTGDATDLSGPVNRGDVSTSQDDRSSMQVHTGPTEDISTISVDSVSIRQRRNRLLSRIEEQIEQGKEAKRRAAFLMKRMKQSKNEGSVVAHRCACSLLRPMTIRKPSGNDD